MLDGLLSCRGNCYGNAPIESFWGLLKNKRVHQRRFKTRTEAIQAITEHIDILPAAAQTGMFGISVSCRI
ncbi:MAG: IS3 family transposase [Nitrosomonadales bacterium]|nr:IS3 family transposase [Nitrosomonadales bacterium]MBL0038532.1 IS3 family transposase [Nitrosomonadales bacterium]